MEFLVPGLSQFRRHNSPTLPSTLGDEADEIFSPQAFDRRCWSEDEHQLGRRVLEKPPRIAEERGEPISRLITSIDAERGKFANLSSAVRMFILQYYRDQLDQESETVAPLDLEPSNSVEVR